MANGSGSQKTIRKAIGALKDTTKVGLVKVNSEYKGIDVAIVKATSHDVVLPKEKHIRTIFSALSATSPRADVTRCIHRLIKRLSKTHNWTVALKTLLIIHRAIRETDYNFPEELISYSRGSNLMLNLSHFRDVSTPEAWDYSAWIRCYALYLEERLECYRVMKYDINRDQLGTKMLDTPGLLEQLPAMQQLLFRLLACKPEGAASRNSLIHYCLSIIARESSSLYIGISNGILNLVDRFFEMRHSNATKALEIYKRASSQAEKLSDFFQICRAYDFGHELRLTKIEQAPKSFVTAMEDYVKQSSPSSSLQNRTVSTFFFFFYLYKV
ncbi:unnamed protein product [Linum tenue]|uniref:ENTH domain-containing protein n=1 Tax=Linum tenue TaxID=586396 RepID=A0AAV0IBV7_9ROSI|nr:unnamed protein product [Linum tenue]